MINSMFQKGYIPWNKGKKSSQEIRDKISASIRGEKNPNFGKKFSEEWRKKLSESHMGQVHSPVSDETRLKMRAAQLHNIFIICVQCEKEFRTCKSRQKNNVKYCSMDCRNESYKGRKQSLETIRKRTIGNFKWGRKVSKKMWKDKNKELVNHYTRVYRARKRGAGGSYSLQEWEDLKKKYNYMCLCCKRFEPEIRLAADHVFPISKGGSSNIENIQPLCARCNSQKYISSIDYRSLVFTYG